MHYCPPQLNPSKLYNSIEVSIIKLTIMMSEQVMSLSILWSKLDFKDLMRYMLPRNEYIATPYKKK